jgi:DNA-binding GntR family transcriptional regulator
MTRDDEHAQAHGRPDDERDGLQFARGEEEPSLEDRAYDAILEWLVQGRGAPGQPIPVREFARALGMSRTPLRTALGRLHEHGFVTYNTRLGFTATIPSPADLHELFDIRLMCESYAVRRYFARPERELPEQIPRLARDTRDLAHSEAITTDVAHAFWERDTSFHRALMTLARNRRLVEWWDRLHVNIYITRAGLRARMTRDRFEISAREHLEIVEAMQADDAELALGLLAGHLVRVRDQTVRFMTQLDELDSSSRVI